MPHHNAHILRGPLCLQRFADAAVRAFEIDPIFHQIALEVFHRPPVKTLPVGESFGRIVGNSQVFADLSPNLGSYSHPV